MRGGEVEGLVDIIKEGIDDGEDSDESKAKATKAIQSDKQTRNSTKFNRKLNLMHHHDASGPRIPLPYLAPSCPPNGISRLRHLRDMSNAVTRLTFNASTFSAPTYSADSKQTGKAMHKYLHL